MEKINIAELLKDCPNGMELDCTIYNGKVCFEGIDARNPACPIIKISVNLVHIERLDAWGQYSTRDYSKCVIFPKGKTTWEGFVPPCKFKDGDILATDLGSVFLLNTRLNTDECYGCFVGKGGDGSFHICVPFAYKECCGLATEEEKQKLFDAIKENGYKWNAETKTLEKLTEQKFDITTLKPFDKVLVRDSNEREWIISFFSHCNGLELYKYSCINGCGYAQCIPYEGNEHLLGKTDDCDEFYKTW